MLGTPAPSPGTIFVQIASYRDPQLIPTLLDLINQARHPGRLRIVVCWQHAADETLGQFGRHGFGGYHRERSGERIVQHLAYRGARVELIDVPHLMSQGACWARNLLQQRYDGERYTLQLDSHHRFIEAWDTLAVEMLESLRDESAKPVLTAYLPKYDPADPSIQDTGEPQIMTFFRFSVEGVVMFRSVRLPDWQRTRPVRARFYSGHFTFADGHFAATVQHDPDYFFLGEEISIAARAFTHGYDLYHPHRLIAWHEYTRRHRVKIWDDHTDEAKARGEISEHWSERNDRAYRRNRALLGVDGTTAEPGQFGRYGLGTARSLADYEAYAGISFAWRGIQRATLHHELPVPDAPRLSEAEWKASLLRANDVRVCLHRGLFDEYAATPGRCGTLSAAVSARVVVHDANGAILHEDAIDAEDLARYRHNDWLDFYASFESALDELPTRYVVELFDEAGDLLSRVGNKVSD
ncbi:GlcNAc-transferase family protein [Burkholderia glumae]|uniref:UDP-N-acetylglucosamine-transferase n=1 Tax=Burkholderia glumae TaxID=337 RepID=A0AAP9XXB4_BURGL|nr:GlcNAc-transferase family protein [Burkholderia glumae]ACR30641.1 Hypothetical protein bglu_2g01530 [Burkholderia glumae BGR1]AJY63786.1 glycosyltransferase family protein [Burkholderia glumae LMG 2196 = ATCC 33617]KHJ64822.1 hypothetical protein NCPPB3923_00830 [Burkholderia glumae]MCM2484070.1 UDP-N-acetylglucosamine-transferase [Burkholderia glumae]MCM2509760.1 UDP-N-acetylglucosamine-transferase [Burkholderia glumae]